MSLRTFSTLRDCGLKLWVDIIKQLTVIQFEDTTLKIVSLVRSGVPT